MYSQNYFSEIEDKISEINVDDTVNVALVVEEETEIDSEPDFDAILESAFLRACKTMNPKKTEFPLLTSNFFRTFIIPNCPPKCSNLDVKKTKWKKLSKFLAEQQTEGLITLKEQKKGVETITAINQEHPKLISFRVIKYEENISDEANENSSKEFEPPIITGKKNLSSFFMREKS